MFSETCVKNSVHRVGGGGGIPACIAGLQGWVGIPACLASLLAYTQGRNWKVWPGGILQAHPWGICGPTPRGVSPGPHPGGCIPACTEADPPEGYCRGRYASYWNAFLLKIVHMATFSQAYRWVDPFLILGANTYIGRYGCYRQA